MSKKIELKIEGFRKLPNPYIRKTDESIANVDYFHILNRGMLISAKI